MPRTRRRRLREAVSTASPYAPRASALTASACWQCAIPSPPRSSPVRARWSARAWSPAWYAAYAATPSTAAASGWPWRAGSSASSRAQPRISIRSRLHTASNSEVTRAAASSSRPRSRVVRHAARRFGNSLRSRASACGSRSVVVVVSNHRVSSTAHWTSRRAATSSSPPADSRSSPNARNVSSIRYRVPPVNVTSTMEASTRRASTLPGSLSEPRSAASRSAVSRSRPSTKTDRCRNSRRSSSVSSW